MNIPVISTDCQYGPREILCPKISLSEEIDYPYFGTYGILIEPFNLNINSKHLSLSKKEYGLARLMLKVINESQLHKRYSKGLARARDFEESMIIKVWKNVINQI